MKTNWEKNLKNQLHDREIPFSEKAWEKLELMMEEEKKPQINLWKKPWLYAVAASVAVFITIGYLNLHTGDETNLEKVGEAAISFHQKSNQQPNSSMFDLSTISSIIETKTTINSELRNSPTIHEKDKQKEVKPQTELVQQSQFNQNQETKTSLNVPEIQPDVDIKEPVEVVKLEPKETRKETKKSYVDPDMLLYSVEHNQAINESETNSRLVLIDFNK